MTAVISILAPHASNGVQAESSRSVGNDIASLIESLDAPRFKLRESATEELVEKGRKALRPLADSYFDSTPESTWRIKRILKKIGTESNDQETSLKAIGVLMVLDHQLDQQLNGLIESWRINRSNRTIEYLLSQGASMAPVRMNQPANFLLRQQPFQMIETSPSPANPLRKSKTLPKLSVEESKSEIAKIIDGRFQDVQKLVLERMSESPPQNPNSVAGAVAVANGARFVAAANFYSTFLEFGDTWKGNSNDIARLKDIHTLGSIRFKNQTLSNRDMKTIAGLENLRHLGFASTKFKSGSLSEFEIPPAVNSVELEDQKIDGKIIGWLASQQLQQLSINDCVFTESAESQFKKLSQLQYLDLARLHIDEKLFRTMEEMTSLQRITISICKFAPNDYRKFEQIRPRIVYFNPVSFLGVQGTRDSRRPGMFSCEIEMVVEDSGADKAGFEPGDVIKAVDGSPIRSFTELRMFISQHDIGEEMSFQVLREGKMLDLTAILGVNPSQIRR